jgi:hypothetical protein
MQWQRKAAASPLGSLLPFLHMAVRRPLTRLMTRTTNPTISSKWIKPPPTCKLKPRSHKMRRTTQMVQSISTSCAHSRALKRESHHMRARAASRERIEGTNHGLCLYSNTQPSVEWQTTADRSPEVLVFLFFFLSGLGFGFSLAFGYGLGLGSANFRKEGLGYGWGRHST